MGKSASTVRSADERERDGDAGGGQGGKGKINQWSENDRWGEGRWRNADRRR